MVTEWHHRRYGHEKDRSRRFALLCAGAAERRLWGVRGEREVQKLRAKAGCSCVSLASSAPSHGPRRPPPLSPWRGAAGAGAHLRPTAQRAPGPLISTPPCSAVASPFICMAVSAPTYQRARLLRYVCCLAGERRSWRLTPVYRGRDLVLPLTGTHKTARLQAPNKLKISTADLAAGFRRLVVAGGRHFATPSCRHLRSDRYMHTLAVNNTTIRGADSTPTAPP